MFQKCTLIQITGITRLTKSGVGRSSKVLCAVPRSSQFILRPLESLQQDKRGKKRVTWSCNFFLKPSLVTRTRECIRGDRGKLVFVCLYKHGTQASKTSLHVPVQYSGMVIRSAWSQTVSGSSSSRAMF